MSRIGKQAITVPGGVNVQIGDSKARVTGPKGALDVPLHPVADVSQENGAISVTVQAPEDRKHKSIWGLTRALLANAVRGVSVGFE